MQLSVLLDGLTWLSVGSVSGALGSGASACPPQTLFPMGSQAGWSVPEGTLFILKPSMLFSPQSEMSEPRQGRASSTGEEEESLAILRR